ncbi:MAG TPA: tetratricopeptide repeat protein [Actinomycetota bacterium]|nr:tetratricopeptide repeat protein [Actinomycetota bacterium]
MNRTARIATIGLIGVAIFLIGGIGLFRSIGSEPDPAPAPAAASRIDADLVVSPSTSRGSLSGTISALQTRIDQVPGDWQSLAGLGLAYVQQARITVDPSYYPRAEAALERSLELQPKDNSGALVGMAALEAARHDFRSSLRWAERALAESPGTADALGVVGDAQLELGRYDDAFDSYQRMVDTRPDLSSYARVSYARELLGDSRGAVEAMEAARKVAGTPADVAWTSFQLGELAFNDGRLADASKEYRRGWQVEDAFVANLAGLAKVAWARGDRDEAIMRYEEVVARLPLPEYVIALGDAYAATGDAETAAQKYEIVRLEQQLFSSNGVNTDLELALFDADHGRPEAALRAARAEWERRRSVHVADALAWALYADGRPEEAQRYSKHALSLGTRNASFLFHAGMIQLALGDRDEARSLLSEAIDTNPYFSIQHSEWAAETLARLDARSAEGA